MAGQGLPDDDLGFRGMIGIGGVEIINTVSQCIVGHLEDLRFVDGFVFIDGQPHGPEAEGGQLQILKSRIKIHLLL